LLIGLILVFVRRANTRFAPTLVSEIGWISITTIYPKIYDRLLKWSETCNFWQDNLMERFNEEIIDSLKSKTAFFFKSFGSLISMVNSCKSETNGKYFFAS